MLARVGLGERLHSFQHQLSGGEQQRVAIARALATGNPVLLADEPTGELDFRTGVQILELLHQQTHELATAVLVVTHNREISRMADRVVELSSGRIVSDGAARGRAGRDLRAPLVARCGRAGFWLRWSLRDLRQRWLLVLTLALVVALATGVGAGLGSMETWRMRSNDASFALLRMHDLRVSLTSDGLGRRRGARRRREGDPPQRADRGNAGAPARPDPGRRLAAGTHRARAGQARRRSR